MREILFRGKQVYSGEWLYGMPDNEDCSADFPCISPSRNYHTKDTFPLDWEVDPETVGQYTGLTDKNGKKIFEGDIIRYADIYDYNCYLESLENPEAYEGTEYSDIWTIDEVVYGIAINYPAFDLNRHSFEANGLSELSESSGYFYEVIGNIHDNPELLGAQS